jgi:hypothetical protein
MKGARLYMVITKDVIDNAHSTRMGQQPLVTPDVIIGSKVFQTAYQVLGRMRNPNRDAQIVLILFSVIWQDAFEAGYQIGSTNSLRIEE